MKDFIKIFLCKARRSTSYKKIKIDSVYQHETDIFILDFSSRTKGERGKIKCSRGYAITIIIVPQPSYPEVVRTYSGVVLELLPVLSLTSVCLLLVFIKNFLFA